MGADSLVFRGPTWIIGTTYYGVLTSQYRNKPFELRINMYETSRPTKPEWTVAPSSLEAKVCEKSECATTPSSR
jgi:hypothetical protein